MGVISPVTAVECRYQSSTVFGDTVSISVEIEEFRGVKLKLHYRMENQAGETVCEGSSEHCFLNREGKIISLKRSYPELYQALMACSPAGD